MREWMEIGSWILAVLGLSGTGILFYRSKKLSEEARAKEAQTKSDLAEADAYITRIKNLSADVKQLSDDAREIREELLKTLSELQTTKEDLMAANALIKEYKLNKTALEETITNLKQENTELRRQNSILRMQTGNLKKRNNKEKAE